MQGRISMDLSFCQAETGFSLDELVEKLADVFARKAFPELLKMILQLVQEVLLNRIFNGKRNAMKCCHKGHLSLNGGFNRRIRTSLGDFKMTFMRVRCSHCGKTFAPLAKFIDLKRFANAREWEEYWKERMRSVGNVVVNIGNYRCFSQDFGQ